MANKKAENNAKKDETDTKNSTTKTEAKAGSDKVEDTKVLRSNVAVGKPGETLDFGNDITIKTN